MMQDITFNSQVQHLLDKRKFGSAFSYTVNMAKRYWLYKEYETHFETIRIVAFKNQDYEQGSFLLSRLAAKLEKEISVMETRQ